MGTILKIFALISSIVSAVYLTAESLRNGLILLSTIVGVLKIIVILTFVGLLAFILYLILSQKRYPAEEETVW
ncbi:MAG: hypothetical protein IPM66_05790 [Acidobacteriota bacterium]|nr:MAG: hypothetical protein IPM66_05790 [Acidobacteriota bacterium]